MASRVLTLVLLALAATGESAAAGLDPAVAAVEVAGDATPLSEAEAHEEEASPPLTESPEQSGPAARSSPEAPARDAGAVPETRPPRR